jgi:hypothetical protein
MKCHHCRNEATAVARYNGKYAVSGICPSCLEEIYGGDLSSSERAVIASRLDDNSRLEQAGPTTPDLH